MNKFTELERDALAEIFNISLGGAAKLMSEMISDEILLSVPSLELISPKEMYEFNNLSKSDICAIEQKFSGGLGNGLALLLFQKESSLKIIQMMMKDYVPIDEVSNFEKDALSEIGNIILTSVLSCLANLSSLDIETEIPEFYVGAYEGLIESSLIQEHENDSVLLVCIDYKIKGMDVKGFIFFLMELNSLAQLSKVLISRLQ